MTKNEFKIIAIVLAFVLTDLTFGFRPQLQDSSQTSEPLYDGVLFDFGLSIEYLFLQRFALGISYNAFSLDINFDAKESEYTLVMDLCFPGKFFSSLLYSNNSSSLLSFH